MVESLLHVVAASVTKTKSAINSVSADRSCYVRQNAASLNKFINFIKLSLLPSCILLLNQLCSVIFCRLVLRPSKDSKRCLFATAHE